MAFKPTESEHSDLLAPIEKEFNKEQFIKDVFNDEYILLVGSEVIMDKKTESTGDVNNYILNVINKKTGKYFKDFNDLEQRSEKGADPIRKLLNHRGFDFNLDDVSPELKALLATKLFPVVLTTTYDSYLETLMRDIWGGRLRIANIDDMDSMNELRDVMSTYRGEKKYNEPTLFYIFGKADKDESKKYVHTDDDAIVIIDKWMQIKKDDQILNLIRNKKVLALGCKFDNWYFRFFWYILKRDISRFGEGQVAFMLDSNNPIDIKLDYFLKHSRVYRHDNARAFMSQASQMMSVATANNPCMKLIINKRTEGGIFLSYSSENIIMASKLFFKLDKLGYKVWFDNNQLKGGDDFNKEIQDAIAQAQVFMPLLTPAVAKDLQNGNYEQKYYVKEWRMASQLGEKQIIPLAVDGYDIKAPYHISIFQDIINDKPSGINLMQPEGFNKLLSSLDRRLRH